MTGTTDAEGGAGASEAMGMPDPSRVILAMAGADARTVLQDVVTNDVSRLAPGQPVYAALLTPQGKYLFDFLLLDPADLGLQGDAAVLIDADAAQAPALAKRIGMYCLRRDARVTGSVDGWGVGLVWGATPMAGTAAVLPDPRCDALGHRVYAPDVAAALQALGAGPGTAEAYDALRIRHGVPASGVELVSDDSYILEAGFDRLNGVDFRKGCYVGQEVTARMRHKTELKKRLLAVRVEGSAPAGTPVTTEAGKPAGTLFTQAGGRGLAHLRLDRAKGPLMAGEASVIAEL